MSIKIYEIDNEGFMQFSIPLVIEPVGLDDEQQPVYEIPEGYVKTPLPTDDNGYQLPFWKPRWNGEEWVEARPKNEIEDEANRPVPKSPISLVKEDVEVLAETVAISLESSDNVQQDLAFLAETVSVSLEASETVAVDVGNVLLDSSMLAETLAYVLDKLEVVTNELSTLKGEK